MLDGFSNKRILRLFYIRQEETEPDRNRDRRDERDGENYNGNLFLCTHDTNGLIFSDSALLKYGRGPSLRCRNFLTRVPQFYCH